MTSLPRRRTRWEDPWSPRLPGRAGREDPSHRARASRALRSLPGRGAGSGRRRPRPEERPLQPRRAVLPGLAGPAAGRPSPGVVGYEEAGQRASPHPGRVQMLRSAPPPRPRPTRALSRPFGTSGPYPPPCRGCREPEPREEQLPERFGRTTGRGGVVKASPPRSAPELSLPRTWADCLSRMGTRLGHTSTGDVGRRSCARTPGARGRDCVSLCRLRFAK